MEVVLPCTCTSRNRGTRPRFLIYLTGPATLNTFISITRLTN